MGEITDALKCPGCHRKGTTRVEILKKTAYARCKACGELSTERIPYPSKRTDNTGHLLPFAIGEIRSWWDDDYEEWHGKYEDKLPAEEDV